MRAILPILSLAVLGVAPLMAEVDPYDQSGVPLEVDTTDPALTKIVLIAGRKSHGPGDHEFFAGCAILMDMLKQTPGVFPVMARDGWPKNEAILKGAKSIVLYMDGRGGHPVNGKLDVLKPLMAQGVGWVNIHYAVDYTKETGATVIDWMGGFYDAEISINPHWTATYQSLPDHPVTRGVKPFEINDEWYYNMRWRPDPAGLTHILKATPPDNTRKTADSAAHPGRSEITAWAYDRPDGGRGFGFTGGHRHKNWGNDDFRRLVVNAILWSAKIDVPKDGAPVKFDAANLERNLDDKRKK